MVRKNPTRFPGTDIEVLPASLVPTCKYCHEFLVGVDSGINNRGRYFVEMECVSPGCAAGTYSYFDELGI